MSSRLLLSHNMCRFLDSSRNRSASHEFMNSRRLCSPSLSAEFKWKRRVFEGDFLSYEILSIMFSNLCFICSGRSFMLTWSFKVDRLDQWVGPPGPVGGPALNSPSHNVATAHKHQLDCLNCSFVWICVSVLQCAELCCPRVHPPPRCGTNPSVWVLHAVHTHCSAACCRMLQLKEIGQISTL